MTHKGKEKRGQGWRRALVFLMTLVLICGLAAPVYAADTTETPEQTNQETVALVTEGEESNQTDLPAEDTPETGNDEAGQDVQTDTPESEPTQADVVGNDNVTDENNVADENNNTETGTDGNNDTESGTGTTTEGDPTGNETTTESNPATESEAPEVEKSLYDRLMAAKTCTEMMEIFVGDMTAASELSKEQIVSVQDKAISMEVTETEDPSAKEELLSLIDLLLAPLGETDEDSEENENEADADTLALNDISIAAGEERNVYGNGYWSRRHSWTTSNESVAKVTGSGYSATVTGVKEGTAVITHTYGGGHYSENFTVTVTGTEANRNAEVFFLATPTSNADSNATDQWGTGITDPEPATVNMTGASWTYVDGYPKNVFNRNDPLAKYIKSWPDGSTGATWTITPDKYPNAFDEVYKEYKNKLENDYGITGLQLSDLTEITLTPHKISQNNSGNYPTHIDCTIDVKCKIAYTVKFNVQQPGEAGYTNVHIYPNRITGGVASDIQKYDYEYPTKTVEGITYVFDGWYDEDGNEVTEWPHAPTEGELADGTVNFYAHYTPKPASLTIKKAFDGLAEGAEKPRTISVVVTGGDSFNKTVELTAANGYTYELTNLDPRVEYTVEENEDSAQITNYTLTKVTYADSKTITPSQDGTSIVTITNTYTPLTTTLTVEKRVTGGLGDKTKQFNFNVTVKNGTENAQFTFKDDVKTGTFDFVLSNGQSANLTVPINSTVTVTEADYGEGKGGYTTTVAGVVASNGEQWTAAAPAEGEANTITFTNFKDATPDTGVLLDSLPYILILAAVVLAVVLMLVLKRRRADD